MDRQLSIFDELERAVARAEVERARATLTAARGRARTKTARAEVRCSSCGTVGAELEALELAARNNARRPCCSAWHLEVAGH